MIDPEMLDVYGRVTHAPILSGQIRGPADGWFRVDQAAPIADPDWIWSTRDIRAASAGAIRDMTAEPIEFPFDFTAVAGVRLSIEAFFWVERRDADGARYLERRRTIFPVDPTRHEVVVRPGGGGLVRVRSGGTRLFREDAMFEADADLVAAIDDRTLAPGRFVTIEGSVDRPSLAPQLELTALGNFFIDQFSRQMGAVRAGFQSTTRLGKDGARLTQQGDLAAALRRIDFVVRRDPPADAEAVALGRDMLIPRGTLEVGDALPPDVRYSGDMRYFEARRMRAPVSYPHLYAPVEAALTATGRRFARAPMDPQTGARAHPLLPAAPVWLLSE
jgi:hypothetical protein